MNIKLVAIVTSILTSVLIIYFFFIIMKPNTNEKVVPKHLNHNRNGNDINNEIENGFNDEIENGVNDEIDNTIDRDLLYNITPLSDNHENYIPANQVNLKNYKDLENSNTEKDFYTNDAPLFTTSEIKNKKLKPIDLNSQHRRVNFY